MLWVSYVQCGQQAGHWSTESRRIKVTRGPLYGASGSRVHSCELQSFTFLQHAIPFSQLEQQRDRSCAFATCIKCGGVSLGRGR